MSDTHIELLKHQIQADLENALADAKKEIRKSLEEDYVLLKKGRLWAALGGAVAMLLSASIISYKGAVEAAKDAVKNPVVTEQLVFIEKARAEAENSLKEITNVTDLKKRVDHLDANAVLYDRNIGLKVQWENHHDHPVGMVANAAWQISREPPKRP
jgi:hypothetical protein